jgi:MerR family redox-sensitive transcriptional activator SoxR
MPGISIGDVARRTGLAPSAIRFYEKAGLLPPPSRSSKQRRFDADAFGRIRIIQLAREAGFTIDETRIFLSGFPTDTRPAERWRALAVRKIDELDAQIARCGQMKTLLESSFRCGCVTLTDCERYVGQRDLKKG